MNNGQLWALVAISFILALAIINLVIAIVTAPTPPKLIQQEKPQRKESVSWSQRLKLGLEKSRNDVWGKLSSIISQGGLNEDSREKVEELLYSADMGAELIDELLENISKQSSGKELNSDQELKKIIFDFLKSKLVPVQEKASQQLFQYSAGAGLKVIMIVGVNGAGKTTTIGKLATKLKAQGAKVVVGACDTFRAAAVEQLQVWCDRAGVEMVRASEGHDPSGVAYDALAKAASLKADYCLLDTAGRLHTAKNLMEELKKTKRVLSKIDANAPHEVLLVLDAITGQNALRQAQEFNEALDLTGLIFTKCDGSSKAGNAVGIASKLGAPVVYVGVGESVEDLDVFETDSYLKALIGLS